MVQNKMNELKKTNMTSIMLMLNKREMLRLWRPEESDAGPCELLLILSQVLS
jgi:hypothetical protein